MNDFKKLLAWQEAMKLTIRIYQLTQKYPKEEKYGLISQTTRSATSIPSNIAEGAGRGGTGEFKNFLGYAHGSSFELETQLIIAYKVNFIAKDDYNQIISKLRHIQKMIYNLKKSLDKKSGK